jgi:Tol biopolymer transport system component
MPLPVGTKLGVYEITAPIGAGGMGEVYRARDTKLKRDVALKVLPDEFAGDPRRIARFQREAELLAALNHPNIATIYGVEQNALVMELVEGDILSCPLPVETAVRYSKQIADALEYAHERGVIHRDLKPANIKVSAEGVVKLLDFGLAKAIEDPGAAREDASQSPTLTIGVTRAGVILGTAAYMSPEQASGKIADRRADIWSFGAVLYEMLAGRRAFRGDSVSDTLATVLKVDPDWDALPAAVPGQILTLLRRCLTKDRTLRLQAIGEARIVLAGPLNVGEVPATAGPHTARLPWAVAALLALVSAALAVFHSSANPPSLSAAVRFQIPPEKVAYQYGGRAAISPDGRLLAFPAASSDGVTRLWLRALGSLDARPLAGTEAGKGPLFWSPDSRHIVFQVERTLKKIDISGGPAQSLCDVPDELGGGSWNREGVIIAGNTAGGLLRVSASGGTCPVLTAIDRSQGETNHLFPQFLPDGRHFLYLRSTAQAGRSWIAVGSLDAKPGEPPAKRLLTTESKIQYVPSAPARRGFLLFLREGSLMAQPFEPERQELGGEAVPIAEQVGTLYNSADYTASENVLVYRTSASASFQLTSFDQQGKVLGRHGEPAFYRDLALSPDGKHAAFSYFTDQDLWLMDLARDNPVRLTFRSGWSGSPVWSPDGSRIAFAHGQTSANDIYQKLTTGAQDQQLLLQSDQDKYPQSWSHDGRYLLYSVVDGKTKADLWVLPLEGAEHGSAPGQPLKPGRPFPVVQTAADEPWGQFSPDGHWIAYVSNESGHHEAYVRPFTPPSPGSASGAASDPGIRWMISKGGTGGAVVWRADGKQLWYGSAQNTSLMSVDVTTSPTFQYGIPKPLFQVTSSFVSATDNGSQFLIAFPTVQALQTPYTVVLNWQAELRK